MEARLIAAVEEAAARAGEGVELALPIPRLADEDIRKAWLISRAPEDEREEVRRRLYPGDAYEPWYVGGDLSVEAVYTSVLPPERTYRRFVDSYPASVIRFDRGCGPLLALDPEGTLSCSFSVQPDMEPAAQCGGCRLEYQVRRELFTSENRPVDSYPHGALGHLPTHEVTSVHISATIPSDASLGDLRAGDAFLRNVEVRPLRAGLGAPSWLPGLLPSAVWAEVEVTTRGETTPEEPLEVEATVPGRNCERLLAEEHLMRSGRDKGSHPVYRAGVPQVVRLANDDTDSTACSLRPGRTRLELLFRYGTAMRRVPLGVTISPAP